MRGFGHGRESGRIFAHGGLRLVLLQLIADKPRHGYELIKDIEEKLQGRYSPSPGVIYPTLTLLEEQGFITQATQDGGRKLSTITPEGIAHLDENREKVDHLMGHLSRGEANGREDSEAWRPPQVVRALHNFKLAMRMRLVRGPMTDAQANEFAAILDTAAQQIERI